MRKQLNFSLSLLLSLLFLSCEEAAKEGTVEVKYENTLDKDLSGKTGSIDDYFYNFSLKKFISDNIFDILETFGSHVDR